MPTRAKTPKMRNSAPGLVIVTKVDEKKSSQYLLFPAFFALICLTGLAANILSPKKMTTNPPIRSTQSWLVLSQSFIKAKLNSATAAKKVSAIAVPIPVMNPDNFPLLSVLWIHKMPIGPKGMEAPMPTRNP